MRRGIILAGGRGTRLHPLTKSVNKQLLPIYDKPLIYYPLTTLMKANIKDILIIAGSSLGLALFNNLLGNGSQFGIKIQYDIQHEPNGIAEAFTIAKSFIDNESVALALGDNIFYGNELDIILNNIDHGSNVIFGCKVKDPTRYGIGVINDNGKVLNIEEKPVKPKSNLAIPGLYFFDETIVHRTNLLKPSPRGELEITDLSMTYVNNPLESVQLELKVLNDTFWFDAGTHDSLLEAAEFIKAVQARTGGLIGDPHSVASQKEWI